jgi:hypothetical protein
MGLHRFSAGTRTYHPLVGEGWPKRDLAESAQSRNIEIRGRL